jgi:quercetin dioxygenase-like cupin family protein
LRYSIDTGGIEPMWAIALRPGQTPPVEFEQFRGDAGGALSRLWDDIWGRPPPDGKPAQTNYVVPLKDAEQRQSPSGTGTVTILARGDNAFVAKLQMDPRAEVPEHRDPTEEYIHVLSGSGTMTIEGQRFAVEAGTTIYMPAHALVKFENGDAPLVALQVFAGPEPAEKYNLWVPVTP